LGFLTDLQNEDVNLYNYIYLQIERASSELDNVQNIFNEFTDHSALHAKTVLENGEKLNTANLNIYEKAIFILSSYFHDIGMNVPQIKINEYINKLETNINLDFYLDKITTTQELEKADISISDKKIFIALNYFREEHNNLSAKRVLELYPIENENSFINGKYIWNCVCKICKAHTIDISLLKLDSYYTDDYYLEGGIKINILYLIILLRLADICHFSRDRAYPYILKDKVFKSEKSKHIWGYYSNVIATTTNNESNVIRIFAECDNFFHHRAIINDIKNIQDELLNSHKLLVLKNSEYQLSWKYVDDSLVRPASNANYQFLDLKFNLNNNKIINLLMGERLYGDPLYAIRECIQNAIDAIKVVSKNTNSKHYIYLNYYEKDEPILEIYDSGTGMNIDIISTNFLSIGTNSYWKSEKGIEEWDINLESFGLIADHGIGALSYFMIAKQIEIFTKYLKNTDYIHIQIDDFSNNILCDNINIDYFPSFVTALDIKPPWRQGHGTCIRFILKKKINFDKLLIFLATNILRCPYKLYLNYINDEYTLLNVWHFRKYDDFNHFDYYLDLDKEKLKNKELYESLYKRTEDFYNRPPEDRSIEDNDISSEYFYGKLLINYSNNSETECRITQNGILIKNAREFVINNKQTRALLKAYGIDIEITGGELFQLNAERTNIINNEYNQTILYRMEKLLNVKYYKNVSLIESSIYFVCGRTFYHGIGDVVFGNPNSVVCFHENFREVYEYEKEYKLNRNYFNSSKLYMVGIERCRSVSIEDIKKEKLKYLLLFKKNNFKIKEISKSIRGEKIIDINKFMKMVKIEITESSIYLPDNNTPFMLPLYNNFEFVLKEENEYVYLIELSDGIFSKKNPLREKIEDLWDQVQF